MCFFRCSFLFSSILCVFMTMCVWGGCFFFVTFSPTLSKCVFRCCANDSKPSFILFGMHFHLSLARLPMSHHRLLHTVTHMQQLNDHYFYRTCPLSLSLSLSLSFARSHVRPRPFSIFYPIFLLCLISSRDAFSIRILVMYFFGIALVQRFPPVALRRTDG